MVREIEFKGQSLSKVLEDVMKNKNISISGLATEMGISRVTLSRLLNNSVTPKDFILEKVAVYLNGDINDMRIISSEKVLKQFGRHSIDVDQDFIHFRSHSVLVARDFNYGENVENAIKQAKTIDEITRILCNARHKKFG